MPRANAKNYTINIAPNANFFALPEFVISHTSKIPAAIAKNFIHYIHSFLLDYSITHKARFVNSFFEIYDILWEIESEYIIYFLCCKNLVYNILLKTRLAAPVREPPNKKMGAKPPQVCAISNHMSSNPHKGQIPFRGLLRRNRALHLHR